MTKISQYDYLGFFEPHITCSLSLGLAFGILICCKTDQEVKRDSKMIMVREFPCLVQVVVALGLIQVMNIDN